MDGIVIHPECRCWPLEKPTFCGAGEMTDLSPIRGHHSHGNVAANRGFERSSRFEACRIHPRPGILKPWKRWNTICQKKCRFFSSPWCTKNDVQCQFHSQIYLRCIISIFVLFSLKSLGLAWISLLDFSVLQTPFAKSHVAPVVQIQVDGMIKVDQSGIRFDF